MSEDESRRSYFNEFVDKVLTQAKAYGIFTYYKELNNDKIPLPENILMEVKNTFSDVYSPREYTYEGDCKDTNKLITFLQKNLNFTYLVYDILHTGYINSYIYQRLDLQFKTNKVEVQIKKLMITDAE